MRENLFKHVVRDVVVVGAGLFGQVIAAHLRSLSMDVTVLDAKKRGAGSLPAACLIKRSWLSSVNKKDFDLAIETLDRLYGVQTIEFSFHGKSVDMFWVPPSSILNEDFVECEVLSLEKEQVITNLGTIKAKQIIVAAGVWTNSLVPSVPDIVGKAGVAFIWEGKQIKKPFINLWRPYTHLVAFNVESNKVWVGDGQAILDKNWRDYHTRKSLARCSNAVKLRANEAIPVFGLRPYVKCRGPCYLQQHVPGVWVATGGAKNGTLGAAWAANELVKRL